MVELEDACEYLGIDLDYMDYTQEVGVDRALRAAESWLKGAVGKNVDLDSPAAEQLMLMAVGEFYEVRVMTDDRLSRYSGNKAAAALNRMAFDLILQLKYATEDGD